MKSLFDYLKPIITQSPFASPLITKGLIDVGKTAVSDIASIKKGITYTPPPSGLSLKEQIEWNQQQSEQARKAQQGIQRTVGGLQMGLESYAPTALGVGIAEYLQKKRGLPSPKLKPEEIKLPTAAKIGINVAGGVGSYLTIGSALGNFMKESKYLAPLIRSYPKLARTTQFIATASTIDQLKAPVDALMAERRNIFFKELPSYIGMGYAFSVPTLKEAIPSAFFGQFLSSKLNGKDTKEAFKEGLTSAAIVSLLKIPAIYKRISVTNQLKNQAREILGVKKGASNEEIQRKYFDLEHWYHPHKGGDPEKFKAVNEAYKVLTEPITTTEQNAWQELKNFYNYLKSNEGRQLALTIVNEMPAGLSVKPISSEKPIKPEIKPEHIGKSKELEKTFLKEIQPEAKPEVKPTITPEIAPTAQKGGIPAIESKINPKIPPMEEVPGRMEKPEIAPKQILKDFVQKTKDEGYLITKPTGKMVFRPNFKVLVNNLTSHKLDKVNLRNIAKLNEVEIQQISEAIDDIKALGGKIPTGKQLIPPDIVKNLPKWEKVEGGWKKVIPTQFKEINLVDKVKPAWRVLEKIGIPNISDKAITAQANINDEIEELTKTIKEYQKIAKGISTEDLFEAAENPDAITNETIRKVINWHKGLMNELADRQNLAYDKRIKNYITHIFDKATTQALKDEKGIPEDLQRAMEYIVPRAKWSPFLQKRLGKELGLQKDFWKATETYLKYALKKIHYDPVIAHARQYLRYLPPESSKYVRKWIQEDLLGRPTDLDLITQQTEKELDNFVANSFTKFGLNIKPKQIARTLTNYTITGLYDMYLGAYPISAVKNFFQKILVLPVVDADMFAKGMTYSQAPEWRKFVMDNSQVWKLRKGAFLPSLDENLLSISQQKTQKALMYLFRSADRDNIIRSFNAGYFEAKKYGLPEDIAIKRGDEVAKRTQYLYNTIFKPQAFRSNIGRMLSMFTSWPINFANYLGDLIRGNKSDVYIQYFKEHPELLTKDTQHLIEPTYKALLKYLFIVAAAIAIQRKTRLKATNYVGISSLKNLLYYYPTALEIPVGIFKGLYAFVEGDTATFKREFTKLRPDKQISFVRFLKNLGVIGNEKDILRAFFTAEKKPQGITDLDLNLDLDLDLDLNLNLGL